MAVFAVYIEKEVSYFGQKMKFGNTYHIQMELGELFNDAGAAANYIAAEKAISASSVTFTGWKTWGPTDGPVRDNVMREVGTASGTGAIGVPESVYAEACLLFAWPLPRSPATNRRRWLRKFIRLGSPTGTVALNVYGGRNPIPDTQRAQLKTAYVDAITDTSPAGDGRLCTADGVLPTGDGFVRPYYYTRQIGR